MPEIFGRVPLTFGGGFAADAANIFFGFRVPPIAPLPVVGGAAALPLAGIGLITQNISINYQQPITRIYEIGARFEYYIAGRPQGNASIGRIVGPRPVSTAFYSTFGNVCKGPLISLIFAGAAGCEAVPALGGDNGFMFMLNGAILQGIGMSVAAQDMIINEQLSFMFIALMVPDDNGAF
jgi:hypothetical protein